MFHPTVALPLDLVLDFGNWNQTEDKPAVWQEVLLWGAEERV